MFRLYIIYTRIYYLLYIIYFMYWKYILYNQQSLEMATRKPKHVGSSLQYMWLSEMCCAICW